MQKQFVLDSEKLLTKQKKCTRTLQKVIPVSLDW